jgi:hypothetical protein
LTEKDIKTNIYSKRIGAFCRIAKWRRAVNQERRTFKLQLAELLILAIEAKESLLEEQNELGSRLLSPTDPASIRPI